MKATPGTITTLLVMMGGSLLVMSALLWSFSNPLSHLASAVLAIVFLRMWKDKTPSGIKKPWNVVVGIAVSLFLTTVMVALIMVTDWLYFWAGYILLVVTWRDTWLEIKRDQAKA